MAEDLLQNYTSTVFACETTKDNRYVRCDFSQCSQHSLNQGDNIPVSHWLLNTPRNVCLLEKHVTREIEAFMQNQADLEQDFASELQFNVNNDLLGSARFKLKEVQKVLVIFNLLDPSSNLAHWSELFLKAAVFQKRTERPNFACVGVSFKTRKELIQGVAKLKAIPETNDSVEVMVVLSCHSSSQGQVFSCTPNKITKKYNFEEFCSLHDFVRSCQDVLQNQLKIVHISSCFALKLDISHSDWPVPATWYENLNCIISGSAKEVYETGSQTADLYLILNTMFSTEPIGVSFKYILKNATMELFPDLCKEMGLCTIEHDLIGRMLENSVKNDKVTPSQLLHSSMRLIIISEATAASRCLKNAIYYNLKTRIFNNSNQKHLFGIEINNYDNIVLMNALRDLSSTEVFVLVIGKELGVCANQITKDIFSWALANFINLYGIHFTELSLPTLDTNLICPVTAFVGEENDSLNWLPVLLYLIHLCLGENSVIDAGSSSMGCWSLLDVFKEIDYVLNGLAGRSRLSLISSVLFSDKEKHMHSKNDYTQETSVLNCDKSSLEASEPESHSVEVEVSNKRLQGNLRSGKTLTEEKINGIVTPYYDSEMKELLGITKNIVDLPLMANVDEVHVYHYVLDLDVKFSESRIDGNILLLIKPAKNCSVDRKFQMCLDCTLINILSVKEVNLPEDFSLHFQTDYKCCSGDGPLCESCSFLNNYSNKNCLSLNYKTLSYATYGWCVRIWKETSSHVWPKCVWISYQTKPVGPSLTWRTDDDGRMCCFTPGAFINNRSMMPCQEPPVAMSTWQATITLPNGTTALSSGDVADEKEAVLRKLSSKQDKDLFYFEMSIPLPSSTLAFAFGNFFRSTKTVSVNCPYKDSKVIEVAMYACQSKIISMEEEFLTLSANYLESACHLLGEYPFSRMDLVLMPRCFACMGLASPNLIFLSPSILCGDGSMSSRIAHEISHAWFGLVLGAKDWTEEWLSEGFATFMEDRILAHAKQMTVSEFDSYEGLLHSLRYRVLAGEMNEVHDENLKLLRPEKKTNYVTAMEAVKQSIEDNTNKSTAAESPVQPHAVVPNAAITSKKFSQVHYLKGYFLLAYLSSLVGKDQFDQFLKDYLRTYKYSLVTSEIFFDFFINYFNKSGSLKAELVCTWLENPSLPMPLKSLVRETEAIKFVNQELSYWKTTNIVNKRLKSRGVKRKKASKGHPQGLSQMQVVLLLELLLDVDTILPQTLAQLDSFFRLASCNAEIRHRWCELVVKHKYTRRYNDVAAFLTNDQGMGIYLFGELMINENKKQMELARQLFEDIRNEMDRSTRETVNEIIYGAADG